MSSKNIFKLFKVFLVAVILGAVILSGCSKALEPVPATFKERVSTGILHKNEITLIKSTEEFENYLGNKELFKEELSEEFKAVNARYDGEFFESNYLVAIIEWAASSETTGYKLVSIQKQDGTLYVNLDAIEPHSRYVTGAVHAPYTYYLSVEKDETLTGAVLK